MITPQMAAMLAMSGGGRMLQAAHTPGNNFGSALGAGLSGVNDDLMMYQRAAQARELNKLRMKAAEQQLKQQEALTKARTKLQSTMIEGELGKLQPKKSTTPGGQSVDIQPSYGDIPAERRAQIEALGVGDLGTADFLADQEKSQQQLLLKALEQANPDYQIKTSVQDGKSEYVLIDKKGQGNTIRTGIPAEEQQALVQVNTGQQEPPYKIPANYMLKDPGDYTKGVVPIPGTAEAKKSAVGAFNDPQTSAAGYANRMEESEKVMQSLMSNPDAGPDVVSELARRIPLIGQYGVSTPDQLRIQAENDWIRAKLRKESGAVIAKEEMEEERKTYFPQIGDSPETILQKAKARREAIEGLVNQSQGAYEAMKAPSAIQALSDDDLLRMLNQ